MNEIARDFRRQSDLDLGEIYPFDEILAGYDPSAHVNDDFFANRLAFAVLLNFPLTTLEQRLERRAQRGRAGSGPRRGWPSASPSACPAEVNLAIAEAGAGGGPLHRAVQHLDAPPRRREGPAPLPRRSMRLLSHWNLRDEIKADYSDGRTASRSSARSRR